MPEDQEQEKLIVTINDGSVLLILDPAILKSQFLHGAEYSRNNPREPTLIDKCRAMQALFNVQNDIPLDEILSILKQMCKDMPDAPN